MAIFKFLVLAVFLFVQLSTVAQSDGSTKKYPSLFWEITGNGLAKPSYLFGTMHVSSKMVFHLSDSFYHALNSTDAVALELNPELWQDQMFRLQSARLNLARFSRPATSDFINEKSFQLPTFEDELKKALSEEPTLVNNLLYRSYQPKADFEENTYLDLYIYQTGRKMGKQPAGVEDYLESERIMLEAFADMAREKNRKQPDTDGQSMFEIEKQMQEAYRIGDLDMMDSLQRLTEISAAFSEKFLYLRNEIQAHSIDTIMQKRSLFVGVGAAHLPGPRGVIEMLRSKGYRLRPIFMQGRDAEQKERIDKMKVPVQFREVVTTDGMVKMQLPGQLYKREEAKMDSWQYADMNNGSYYMLTRVRTHAGILGISEKNILKKIDRLFYENIPGKIISKEPITKAGYHGFDIVNRTRRGDMQRYQVLVTPFEVLVFKMSGHDSYVDGEEAAKFFSSIEVLSTSNTQLVQYRPSSGGFTVKLPHSPVVSVQTITPDRLETWTYEAIDKKTGDAYMLWRKPVYNYSFLEEDTFDLALMDESFQRSEIVGKQIARKMIKEGNRQYLQARYALKDGGVIQTRSYIQGANYYMLVARSHNKSVDFGQFFSSFSPVPFQYASAEKYIDPVLKIQVMTPVVPKIDTTLRSWIEKAAGEDRAGGENYDYWPKSKTGVFRSPETGEAIVVEVETFPKYYYSRDSAKFWRDRLAEKKLAAEFIIHRKEYFRPENTLGGYHLVLTDTNSSRSLRYTYLLKDNHLLKFVTLTDTAEMQSSFLKQFFATVRPMEKSLGPSIFENKLNLFFADYHQGDSTAMQQARQAISNVYFGSAGLSKIVEAINALKYTDKDYFELKSKFIAELGYIDDTAVQYQVVQLLKDLYCNTADTAYFQNAIVVALARLKTAASYQVLKELLVQDPPIFENGFEYTRMFSQFSDSLALAKSLFPEILQLADVEDYRLRINALLRQMVDSNQMQAKEYEGYFNRLAFDATIQLKKQQVRDEKRMEQETKADAETTYGRSLNAGSQQFGSNSSLYDYSVLLMPFYNDHASVKRYFNRLLQSKDPEVQMSAAILMIRNNQPIPDSLLENFAKKDNLRAQLYTRLEKIKRGDLFPAKYRSQELIATSLLLADKNLSQLADVKMVNRKLVDVKGRKGWVYYYKYKVKPDDEWKIGISGIQPQNENEISSNKDMVKMTDKRLKQDEPEQVQFDRQVKQLLFSQHKSSRNFFVDNSLSFFHGQYGDVEIHEGEVEIAMDW